MTMTVRSSSVVLLPLALLLGGCPVPTPSVPGNEPAQTHEEPEAEPGPSLAGTWTRQGDPPLVFNVTDDGRKVHGELLEGGEQVFASYRFDLDHKAGGKLAGKATFALADLAGKTFESAWEGSLSGTTVTLKQEELEIEEDGSVSKRTKVDKTYAFAASAAAPQEAPPAAPPAMDPYQFVQAPGRVDIAPDAAVGYMARQTSVFSGNTSITSYAIVGESGDSWLVEAESPTIGAMAASFPDLKGAILGLTVTKADGKVTKAVGGKPGEAGKPLKIMDAPAPAASAAPEGTDEKVTIGLGEFDAKKVVQGSVKSWVGTGGDTKGVLLKTDGGTPESTYELAELPSMKTVDCGGRSVETRYTAYTNGMKMWQTEDPVVCAFFGSAAADGKRVGLFKMEMSAGTMEITALKTDAAPQLKW